MKVTISFNGTKIVVPCADGEISVREVTTLAATRYKKAIGKTNSYWVSVASLKSHEGGILDADDLIGMYFIQNLSQALSKCLSKCKSEDKLDYLKNSLRNLKNLFCLRVL